MNTGAIPKDKLQEVQELIDKSGNGFQYRVINCLRDLGWKVLVSPYYNDSVSDKPREIDIIAEKEYQVNSILRAWLGTVTVRLFLECKYINKSTVFWFDEKDRLRARERVIADMGYRSASHGHEMDTHHYYSEEYAAKLFATKDVREDGDPIYKAIAQSINAMVYYRNRPGIFPQPDNVNVGELHSLSFPIIVVNAFDEFYGKNVRVPESANFLITDPFQLEVNYAYLDQSKNSQNEYFIIDVTSIDHLGDFISRIEKTDISPLINNLSFTQDPGRRWQRHE